MGLSPFSRSSYDSTSEYILPNPNPKNFEIKRIIKKGKYVIAEINYPDCKNYEGNKILVFDNVTIDELRNFSSIDPHFSNNKQFKSPIARFEPTKKGWKLALKLVEI